MDIIKKFGIHYQVVVFSAVVHWGGVLPTAKNDLGSLGSWWELRHCHIPSDNSNRELSLSEKGSRQKTQ